MSCSAALRGQPEGIITAKEMDLAASIQVVCEEAMLGRRGIFTA